MPKEGEKAPVFSLPDQDGGTHTLADYQGQWVLIYFYPKDMTSGCTKEACMLRDSFPDFGKLNARIFGISADSVESHKKFAAEYDLPFPLLADTEKKAIASYGVWGEKEMMGKKYMGIFRTSFLVGPDGTIKKVYQKVKPDIHAEEVLADLKKFGA